MHRKIYAIDLFCGAGGLTHGMSSEGIQVQAGLDSDQAGKYPYEKNNPAKFLHQDITTVSGATLKNFLPKTGYSLLAGCARGNLVFSKEVHHE